MRKRCVLKAPAKLNLHLQIGSRRKDGFHDIKSLFVMVDLFDEIDASSLKTGNDCRINGDFNCAAADNLIYKAWREFCIASGQKHGVVFSVEKNIPSFAGLGGGSSDAAAALAMINLMSGTPFTTDELSVIGSKIGSDVPFFLNGPAAVISSRGEDIKNTEARILNFILVLPDINVSTADAYRWIDESKTKESVFLSFDEIIDIYKGDLKGFSKFKNDFTDVLVEKNNVFSKVIDDIYSAGAVFGNVTGSGSAVFGLFENEESTRNAEKKLQNRYKFVQKIKSLDRIPYAILE